MLIGIGNIDREDDGVGYRVVERLHALHPDWPVLLVRQLLPEMVAQVDGAAHVIFVDADLNVPAGEMKITRVVPASRTASSGLGSHHLDPPHFMSLLQLVLAAGTKLPAAWCCHIGIERLGDGTTLSARVETALIQAASEIEEVVTVAQTVRNL